jgi:hypothetical protein
LKKEKKNKYFHVLSHSLAAAIIDRADVMRIAAAAMI